MNLKLSSKQIISILLICLFITSLAGVLVTIMIKPYDLYIKLKDIHWPPEHINQGMTIIGEIYVFFDVYMLIEIWNPSKQTLVFQTPHSNLLDPQMKIVLEGDYPTKTGYGSWIHLTTHIIRPGITADVAVMGVEIDNYNDSILPDGTYTVWAGIVINDNITVKSYKTIIHQENNESNIDYQHTPRKWGIVAPCYRKLSPPLLWTLTGGELIAIMYFYRTNRELLVNVYFHKTNQRKKKNN